MEDYEFKTTFWQDFSIADMFGISAIKDTFKRAFKEWKDNTEYFTELSLVMNWKCWQHYEKGRHTIAGLYDTLWNETKDYVYENWNEEQQSYYFRETD